MIVQCATFSKSLNHRNIKKSVSGIWSRMWFLFDSSFWISVSGCKLTILPDIQPANRIVIICTASCQPLTSIANYSYNEYTKYSFKIYQVYTKFIYVSKN